jgi:hypothetical protein
MRGMSSRAVVVAAFVCGVGCGGVVEAPLAESSALFAPLAVEAPASSGEEVALPSSPEPYQDPDPAPVDLSTLPASPWSDAPVASESVPAPILRAWAGADNRTQCAPLAPLRLGAGEGARARVSDLEGGWAVEFDHRGMPGLDASGEPCEQCGRAVFGLAGTNLAPEDLSSEEGASAPSFADGSRLLVEPPAEGEQVASASLTVRGQGCVYQVWSFLGEEHVRELVSALRLVSVSADQPVVASR